MRTRWEARRYSSRKGSARIAESCPRVRLRRPAPVGCAARRRFSGPTQDDALRTPCAALLGQHLAEAVLGSRPHRVRDRCAAGDVRGPAVVSNLCFTFATAPVASRLSVGSNLGHSLPLSTPCSMRCQKGSGSRMIAPPAGPEVAVRIDQKATSRRFWRLGLPALELSRRPKSCSLPPEELAYKKGRKAFLPALKAWTTEVAHPAAPLLLRLKKSFRTPSGEVPTREDVVSHLMKSMLLTILEDGNSSPEGSLFY